MFLIISMPFTLAQSDKPVKELVAKEDSGGVFSAEVPDESFTQGQLTNVSIFVNRYEPTVLVSSTLEEQNVPVYAFLSASPTESTELPRIQKVSITEVGGNKSSTIGVRYYEPKVWTWSDIGHVELRLKKIEKEHKVPDKISVDLKARIEYEADVNTKLFGGAQTKILKETPIIDLYTVITNDDYEIFGHKGKIVLRQIGTNSAIFSVHDHDGKLITTVSAYLGKDSPTINLEPGSTSPEDQVRIRLNKIIDKTKPLAEISINDLNHTMNRGTRILDWNTDEIVDKCKDPKSDPKICSRIQYIQLSKIGNFGGTLYLPLVESSGKLLGKSSEIEKEYYQDDGSNLLKHTGLDKKKDFEKLKLDFKKLKSDWGDFEVKEISEGRKPNAVLKVSGEPSKPFAEGEIIVKSLALTECAPSTIKNECKLESVRGGSVRISHPDRDLNTGKCTPSSTPLSLRNLDKKYL